MFRWLAIFFTVVCYSQTGYYEGRVLDAQTDLPLNDVHIYSVKTALGTNTDTNGEFTFYKKYLTENDTLMFSYLGYEELKIPVSELNEGDLTIVKLSESHLTLDVIEVTSNYFVRDLLEKSLLKIDENHVYENVEYSGVIKKISKEDDHINNLVYSNVKLAFPNNDKDKDIILRAEKTGINKTKEIKTPTVEVYLSLAMKYFKIKTLLKYYLAHLDDNKYNYSVEEGEYKGTEIYKVTFLRSPQVDSEINERVLYFEKDSKALVRIYLGANHKVRWINISSEDKPVFYKAKFSWLEINFKQQDGKWVFDEFKSELFSDYRLRKKNNKETIANTNLVELKFDGVITEPSKDYELINLNRGISSQIENDLALSDKFNIKDEELMFLMDN